MNLSKGLGCGVPLGKLGGSISDGNQPAMLKHEPPRLPTTGGLHVPSIFVKGGSRPLVAFFNVDPGSSSILLCILDRNAGIEERGILHQVTEELHVTIRVFNLKQVIKSMIIKLQLCVHVTMQDSNLGIPLTRCDVAGIDVEQPLSFNLKIVVAEVTHELLH